MNRGNFHQVIFIPQIRDQSLSAAKQKEQRLLQVKFLLLEQRARFRCDHYCQEEVLLAMKSSKETQNVE